MSRDIALLFLGPRHSRWGWRFSPTPRPPLPPGKTRYALYRRLGGPQGRSGQAENLVSTGFRSRTVQPLVSFRTLYFSFISSLSVAAEPTASKAFQACYIFMVLLPLFVKKNIYCSTGYPYSRHTGCGFEDQIHCYPRLHINKNQHLLYHLASSFHKPMQFHCWIKFAENPGLFGNFTSTACLNKMYSRLNNIPKGRQVKR